METKKYWEGKKAKIQILNEGKKLIYTATILELDNSHITFIDREGLVYSFHKDLVTEMGLIE